MEENNLNPYWYKATDSDDLHQRIFGYVEALDTAQSYRLEGNIRGLRLYGNMEPMSLKNFNTYRAEPVAGQLNRVTFNIVQSMVDTVVSKITKNQVKVTFLTEGGDWTLQRRAKRLTQFGEGQFQCTNFPAKAAVAFQDSLNQDAGVLKIFRKGSDIQVERVFPSELVVDDGESIYGDPRQMHQKKYIHKEMLVGMFPKSTYEIMEAGSSDYSAYASNTYDKNTDMLMVIESWHLPSGPKAKDGRHVISISNKTLLDEPWEKEWFPFVFMRWSLGSLGFWGHSLAEQLAGLQLEINKILRTIQISMHLVSVPKLLIEASSKIVESHLNNKIGGIIKYAGQPPTYAQLGSIPPELFTHLDRLYARSFEIAGVSQLSANSAKPSGLDSGKALREFNDIETERFMAVGKRWEQFHVDALEIMIDLAKEIDEELREVGESYSVKTQSGKALDTIDWRDVSMEEDQYVMRVFPTSALSSTPAGRLQDVQDLIAAGFVSKEDAMKLLDFPDLQQFYNFNNAGIEDIERAIELIIDKGRYETPEPYQNLVLGIQKFQQAYLLYRTQNAPEDKLELLRRWMEDANILLTKANNANNPPAAPMPQGPPPGAQPNAPPITPPSAAPVPVAA